MSAATRRLAIACELRAILLDATIVYPTGGTLASGGSADAHWREYVTSQILAVADSLAAE